MEGASGRSAKKPVHDAFDWLMIGKNDKKTLQKLQSDFGFHDIDLEDVAPPIESPKCVTRGNYVFLILQFPTIDPRTGYLKNYEVDFFITTNRLVSIDTGPCPNIREIFNDYTTSNASRTVPAIEDIPHLMHFIASAHHDNVYQVLKKISTDLMNIESRLFNEIDRGIIRELLKLKMNIVGLRSAIQNQTEVLENLHNDLQNRHEYNPKLNPYFNELIVDARDIWHRSEFQLNTVNALQETNDSLYNFETNSIIRVLTVFSVIVFPLTLLAAIFGMNAINMPFVNHPLGFWMIVGIMLVGSSGMLLFFKSKRWL